MATAKTIKMKAFWMSCAAPPKCLICGSPAGKTCKNCGITVCSAACMRTSWRAGALHRHSCRPVGAALHAYFAALSEALECAHHAHDQRDAMVGSPSGNPPEKRPREKKKIPHGEPPEGPKPKKSKLEEEAAKLKENDKRQLANDEKKRVSLEQEHANVCIFYILSLTSSVKLKRTIRDKYPENLPTTALAHVIPPQLVSKLSSRVAAPTTKKYGALSAGEDKKGMDDAASQVLVSILSSASEGKLFSEFLRLYIRPLAVLLHGYKIMARDPDNVEQLRDIIRVALGAVTVRFRGTIELNDRLDPNMLDLFNLTDATALVDYGATAAMLQAALKRGCHVFKSPNRYGSWNRITTADGSRLQTDNRSDIQLLGIGARDVESVFGLFAKIQKLTIAFDDDFHVLTDKMKWLIDECVSHETTWLGVVQTCSNDYDVLDLFLELLDEILERPKVCSNIIKRISMGKPFGDAILSDFDENAQPEEKEYGDMVYDLHAKAAKLERRIPIEVLELGDIYSAMHMHVGPMLTYVCLEIFECVNTLGLTEIPLNLQSGGQTVPAIVQLLPRVNAVTHLYMDACSDVGLCLVLLDIFAPAGNLHSLRIPITCFSSEDWSRNVFKALSTHKQLSRLEFVAGRCAGQVEDIMRSFVPPIIGDRIPASVHTFAAHGCGNLGTLLGWIPPTCVRVTVSGVVEKDQEFATGIGIRAATGVASQTKYMDVRIHEWSKYAIMSDPLVIKYIIGAYPNLVDLKYANDNVSVVELPKPSEYDKFYDILSDGLRRDALPLNLKVTSAVFPDILVGAFSLLCNGTLSVMSTGSRHKPTVSELLHAIYTLQTLKTVPRRFSDVKKLVMKGNPVDAQSLIIGSCGIDFRALDTLQISLYDLRSSVIFAGAICLLRDLALENAPEAARPLQIISKDGTPFTDYDVQKIEEKFMNVYRGKTVRHRKDLSTEFKEDITPTIKSVFAALQKPGMLDHYDVFRGFDNMRSGDVIEFFNINEARGATILGYAILPPQKLGQQRLKEYLPVYGTYDAATRTVRDPIPGGHVEILYSGRPIDPDMKRVAAPSKTLKKYWNLGDVYDLRWARKVPSF